MNKECSLFWELKLLGDKAGVINETKYKELLGNRFTKYTISPINAILGAYFYYVNKNTLYRDTFSGFNVNKTESIIKDYSSQTILKILAYSEKYLLVFYYDKDIPGLRIDFYKSDGNTLKNFSSYYLPSVIPNLDTIINEVKKSSKCLFTIDNKKSNCFYVVEVKILLQDDISVDLHTICDNNTIKLQKNKLCIYHNIDQDDLIIIFCSQFKSYVTYSLISKSCVSSFAIAEKLDVVTRFLEGNKDEYNINEISILFPISKSDIIYEKFILISSPTKWLSLSLDLDLIYFSDSILINFTPLALPLLRVIYNSTSACYFGTNFMIVEKKFRGSIIFNKVNKKGTNPRKNIEMKNTKDYGYDSL